MVEFARFLAASLALACSSPAPRPLEFCCEEPVLHATAKRVADRWAASAGIRIDVDPVCEPWEKRIVAADIDPPGRSWPPDLMAVRADRTADDLVVLHEMGHMLGAGHHGEPGVMNGRRPLDQITAADLASLCEVNECRAWAPESEASR